MTPGGWVDRITEPFAPRFTLRRQRARIAAEMLVRHYESASAGRRTSGWRRSSGDANAVIGGALARLRDVARDLVRNDAYAESALTTIVDHCVGWGITAKPVGPASPASLTQATDRWKAWAETTACDADGRLDFAGLEKLVVRTVAESGEALVRRRWRRPEDNLPIPMQLQILEPDYLDHSRDGITTAMGGRIIQGVEFDPIGRRIAYWLFPEHPGAMNTGMGFGASQRIVATEILHIFKSNRPGQVRGTSWFAPVILTLKDFTEYEDAALMKQKVAACLAVITSDVDGTAPALGATTAEQPGVDSLEPAMILNVAAGRSVTVVDPPTISEHASIARTWLQKIAAGLGVNYEDLCGDYTNLPFSAARMSRLRHWAHVDDWRWRMLIPQFCDPVWVWAMQAAAITGLAEIPGVEWTAPPPPMIDPPQESLAYERMVRNGQITWPEMVRERGYDPDRQLPEIVEWNKKFDAAGVRLDCDPRYLTQAGQLQGIAKPSAAPAPAPATPMNGAKASRNGHEDGDLARAFALLERALSQRPMLEAGAIHVENHPAAPAPAPHVDARTEFRMEPGAIHTEVHAPPVPTITVAPAEVRIEKGAIHAEMHAPDVLVEAPVVRIEEGAVQVSAPVTITPVPPPPTVTVIRTPKRRRPSTPTGPADHAE